LFGIRAARSPTHADRQLRCAYLGQRGHECFALICVNVGWPGRSMTSRMCHPGIQ